MKKNKTVTGSSILLLALLNAGSASAQEMGKVNGDAEHGALLYYQHGCYGCHGFSGYGREDLNNTGSPFLLNEDVFTAFLRARAEVAPLLPSTSMPNYPANALDDTAARDIYAYVRSMPENSPAVEDVPVLQAIIESAQRSSYTGN